MTTLINFNSALGVTCTLHCSGAAYWAGGSGSPGYVYTLSRVSGVLKKFSLAGNTLTLAAVAGAVGNFTTYGGVLLSLTACRARCAFKLSMTGRCTGSGCPLQRVSRSMRSMSADGSRVLKAVRH